MVNMTIPGPPTMSISPTTLDFGTNEVSMSFRITNAGGGTLSWEIFKDPDCIWISPFDSESGSLTTGQSITITIEVDRNGLEDGDYSSIININSNGGIE